jgi:hypothetical protein
MDILYPLALFALFGAVSIALCARSLPGDERAWLVRWMTLALVLRLAMATAFALDASLRLFHEDADGYEWLGMAMARGWHGDGPLMNPLEEITQNYGYKYVAGGLYYVFGQFQPLLSYLSCLVGTLTIYLVYRLSRMYFHPLVARRAALMAALFPSMILWSSVAMKDALMSFLILLTLIACVSLKRRLTVWNVLLLATSIVAMQPIRFYMVYFLGFSVLISLFLERGASRLSGFYKQALLIGVFAALLAMTGIAGGFSEGTASLTFESASRFRHNMAVTAASGFDTATDVSTPGRALAYLPLGISELLLGPYPWQFGSLRALFAAPETIYWWLLFPSVIRGMVWAFRKRFAETAPLVLFAVTMTCAYSLVHGNVGSGFRQRAQIFVILFIFAAFGMVKRRAERLGIDSELLLADEVKRAPAATVVAAPATAVAARAVGRPAA